MNSERRCTVLNHRNSIATHICIFKDCNKDQRWVCGECILNNTHQHGITSKNHILHYSDLPQKIKPQQSQMEINLKQMVKLVEDSISFQQNLKDVINENLESCTKNRKKAENVTQQQIFASSSQEIQELLFPSFKINQTQIADCQSKILTNRQQLDKGFRTILDNQINYQEVQVIPQQVIKIEQNVEKIYSAQVFPNGQYIAFGGDDSQLYIQHLKQNDRNIINIGEKIRYIQVSNDSKQIFVGTVAGSIINLNEQSNFQFLQIFRYHTNQIFQILIISQSIIITSSYDETIVIFDFIAKNALNTIRLNSTLCDFQNNFYYCIDYSFDKQLIAGGSNQQKITLWNYDGSVYLQHFQSINTDTRIIQFSQDYKYLMTLDSDSTSIFSSRIRNTEIKIWSIDYERGALNLIKRHREDQNIYNFSFLQNDQFLCLILENTIKLIRAIDYSTVNQIQHGIHDIFPFRTKQLDSMNPIVVKGKSNKYIFILKIYQILYNLLETSEYINFKYKKMNSVKTCMKIGHKKSRAEHICTYIDCPLDRWCCTECLIDIIHSHGNNQSNYILHYTEFIKQIQAQSNPNLGKWQQLLQMVAELIELLQSFKNLIKDNLNKNNVNKNCIDLLSDNNQDQVLQLQSEDITNLLKYQPQNIKIYDSLEDSYAKINRRKSDMDMLFKNSIDIKEVQSKSLIKPWVKEINSDYKVIKLETKTSYNLYAAQVSPCEKFVAFGGDDSKLRIHYLLSCRTIYMNLNDQIRTIEIQKDSKQIFIGGFHGNVILLKSLTNFQEQCIYKYQEKTIYQIIIISNSEILSSSSDETIVRFDYVQQIVMSRINFRSSWIDFDRNFARCIDINPENLMVAGGSNQQTIHLWDLDGYELIKQQGKVNQNVRIINYIDKYTKLITLETDGLQLFQSKLKNIEMKIWFINFSKMCLELQKQVKDQQNIYHLQYYRNQEYIVFILEHSIKIFRSDMTLVQQIQHEVDDLYPYQCKQLESMTKLIVKGKSKYYLYFQDSLHLFDFRK